MIKINPRKKINDLNVTPIWELGQEGGRTRPINREALFQNLVEVKEVFDNCCIPFMLSHGTMLGIWRDGDFIPWDDDVDIALFVKDKHKFPKAIEDLKKLGFFIPPNAPTPTSKFDAKKDIPWYDFVAIKRGEKIEGWFFEKIGDYYVYDFPRCGDDLKHPAKYYEPMQKYEWKGHTWNIPNHIEDWLLLMYGTGWNVVDKNRKYNNQQYDSNGNPIPQNYKAKED